VVSETLDLTATIFHWPAGCLARYEFEGFSLNAYQFSTKHLRNAPGTQIEETLSYQNMPGLDNSAGSAPNQVQTDLQRKYNYQIKIQLSSNEVSEQRVRDKIAELYKLPPNDPEGEEQTAKCPLSIVIPAGQKATVSVEWTERWAEGLINKGTNGEGDRLGSYRVFLGYLEPCSLVKQENVK
jgi:hypothetical protein